MKEESLTASRFVYDTVKSSAVHFSEIRLTPRLKRNVRAARMRWLSPMLSDKKFMKAKQMSKVFANKHTV